MLTEEHPDAVFDAHNFAFGCSIVSIRMLDRTHTHIYAYDSIQMLNQEHLDDQ